MPRFAATIKAFEKGVENISIATAVKLIEDWEAQLGEAEFKGSKGVLRDLEALKTELGKGEKMKGERVQQLTAKLGQETLKAAEAVEGGGAERLKQMGDILAGVGEEQKAEAK